MKDKISEFFESGVGVIVTLVFIGFIFSVISVGKYYYTRVMEETSKTGDSALETVYTKYEGSVKGAQVQSAIKEFVGDENIWVSYVSAGGSTQSVNYADGSTTLNGTLLSTNDTVLRKMNKKTDVAYYINPNTSYYGEIVRGDQGIVGIRFTVE